MSRPAITVAVAAVAMALLLAACGGGAEGGEFTTLSYNVAGLPQEVSQETPEEHIPLISPLINDYDIVLTQEDFDWWVPSLNALDFVNYHTRLRSQVDHPYQSEQHPGPEGVGIDVQTDRPTLMVGDGLGILSRFPFDEFRRVPWESCAAAAADCLAMKGFGMARVELGEGAVVDVYTLHAEAGGEQADNEARAAGFELLAAYIEQNSAGHAIILGGDTNLHTEPDSEDADDREDARVWAAFIERAGLVDVCDALTCADPTRIDKFAFRSAGDVELEPLAWQFEVEKFVGPEGEPLSDHDALLVRWSWSPAD
jgi:hypothetical protein